MSSVEDGRGKTQCDALSKRLEPFLPFVSESFVSFCEEEVPVKILRDTAAFDSDTGSCIPVLGIGNSTAQHLKVPQHPPTSYCIPNSFMV